MTSEQRSANVIGLGLIGGSIATGLRQRGWRVHGDDSTGSTVERALELGLIDQGGLDPDAAITFVAVAFILFLIVKAYNSWKGREEDDAEPGPTEVELLADIRDALRSR